MGAAKMTLVVKNPPDDAGDIRDAGSIPGSGRSPGGGHGNPSSSLAWRIPWTKEPGGLQSMGSHKVRHNWSDSAHTHGLDNNLQSHLVQRWCEINFSNSWSVQQSCQGHQSKRETLVIKWISLLKFFSVFTCRDRLELCLKLWQKLGCLNFHRN